MLLKKKRELRRITRDSPLIVIEENCVYLRVYFNILFSI